MEVIKNLVSEIFSFKLLIGLVLGGSLGLILGGIMSMNTVDAKNTKINRLQEKIKDLK